MNKNEIVAAILERLDKDAEVISREWNMVHPGTETRFCTIDNLLPESVANEISEAFPKDAEGFHTLASFREHKRTSSNFDALPPILGGVTFAMQASALVAKISELTGMPQLEPDPQLYAGGLSMMFKNQFLNPHIDNSHESTKSKYRRLNLLYYVTPDWNEGNGGNLELWDDGVKKPVTITSAFNRLVLMETNRRSWHSVSPVIAEGPRCCVSNYYFSELSPTGDDYYHVTSFTGRPEQKARRALGVLDNAARNAARHLGARRKTDNLIYQGEMANTD
jgi:Rps23 Pro-64 3,4-dihydroxylase Tpa1-like proline 4-hydroxylase